MDTRTAIEQGTIKIKGTNIVGLGVSGDEYLSIDSLNEMIATIGKSGAIRCLAEILTNIVLIKDNIQDLDNEDNPELKKFIEESLLPRIKDIDFYTFNEVIKSFL